MSTHAALVPVPFYAPARIQTGKAGPFFNHRPRARDTARLVQQERSATPDPDAGLVYDQRGTCVGDKRLGWLVNVWA
jgi:hypothetical protein